MQQAQAYKQYIVKIIDPSVPELSQHHLTQLTLVLDLARQMNPNIEILQLIQLIKTQHARDAIAPIQMFFDEELQILEKMQHLTVGVSQTEVSTRGLGNLQTQLEQLRKQLLPAETEYDEWSLHALMRYSYLKNLYKMLNQTKAVIFENFDKEAIKLATQVFASFNGTAMALQLQMDDFFQFQLHKKYKHEPFPELEVVLKSCFKTFYFGPAAVFLANMNKRILEKQTSLMTYLEQFKSDPLEYKPTKVPWEGIDQVKDELLMLRPLDPTFLRHLELVKRVAKDCNQDTYRTMVGQLCAKLQGIQLPILTANAVQNLINCLQQATEATYLHVINVLQNSIVELREQGNNTDVRQQQVVQFVPKPVMIDLNTITKQELQNLEKDKIIELFMQLQLLK